MALASVARGTGQTNTGSQNTIVITPSGNLAAGSKAILIVAYDNSGTNGADPYSAITDSAGNTWTPRANGLNDPGAANAGVAIRAFETDMDVATLTTGHTITVSLGGITTVARTWVLWEITCAAGKSVEYIGQKTPETSTTANPTITSPSAAVGDIIIGAIGREGNDAHTADSDTTRGSWSTAQATGIGTTTSGIQIASQTKVTSSTTGTQTYNPTFGASRDNVEIILQYREATATAAGKESLAPISVPNSNDHHKLGFRARKSSGSGTVRLRARLWEGASDRSGRLESADLTTSFADYELPISSAKAATITDYSNLDIEWWGFSPTRDTVNIEISAMYLETEEGVFFITLPSIPTAEALGSHTVTQPSTTQDVTLPSIASAEAMGGHTVSPGTVNVTLPSISSAESLGSHTATPGAVNVTLPSITSEETMGGHTVTPGVVDVTLPSIASAEAMGGFVVTTLNDISLSSITSEETLGDHTIEVGPINFDLPSITSEEDLGDHTVTPGAVDISLSSIDSEEALGSHSVGLGVSLPSIDSEEAFGDHTVTPGVVDISLPSIASAESLGSHVVSSIYNLTLPSIESEEDLGDHSVGLGISLPSITSEEALGDHSLAPGPVDVVLPSIASAESLGAHTVTPGSVDISLPSIESEEELGNIVLQFPQPITGIGGIESEEQLGDLVVTIGDPILTFFGIESQEELGDLVVTTTYSISLPSIESEEDMGEIFAHFPPFNFVLPLGMTIDSQLYSVKVDQKQGHATIDSNPKFVLLSGPTSYHAVIYSDQKLASIDDANNAMQLQDNPSGILVIEDQDSSVQFEDYIPT